MKNIIKELALAVICGDSLESTLNKGIKKSIREEVKALNDSYYSLATQGVSEGWTSGLINHNSQYSKEVKNIIRNKSLEIFLKQNKDCKIVKSEPGWDYEKYNVLIKIGS